MSRQVKPLDFECAKANCHNQATFGVFGWTQGALDVNLNRPVSGYCDFHKPKPAVLRGRTLRMVRLNLELITEKYND